MHATCSSRPRGRGVRVIDQELSINLRPETVVRNTQKLVLTTLLRSTTGKCACVGRFTITSRSMVPDYLTRTRSQLPAPRERLNDRHASPKWRARPVKLSNTGIRVDEGTGLRVLFVSNGGEKRLKQPPEPCPLLRSQPSRSAYLLNSSAPVSPAEH
jgi:hypothetical protein